ncbi:MAG TPA: methyltransferase domain-containing protein [Nitrospirae bacterium]|nr:methyltransferase domain-containing protein [Nitrospirota bacterium]
MYRQSKYAKIISILYPRIAPHIRASRTITKLIFKVTPYPRHRYTHWDLCTLVLKKALDKYVKEHQRILEMGSSDTGILCMYIAKKRNGLNVTGVDISPDFVENAGRNAEKNNLKITFIQSDLFSNIEGSFDVIFFNPPYNPTEWGRKYMRNIPEKGASNVWDGGKDSYDIIRRFLGEAPGYLSPDGKILLGTMLFFQEESRLLEIFNETGLELISTVSARINPGKVYVLGKKA